MTRRRLASLVGSAVLLAACGGTDTAAPPSVTGQPSAPPSATAPASTAAPGSPDTQGPPTGNGSGQVQQALAFQAPLLDGSTFDGAVTGDVVLWFWAPW